MLANDSDVEMPSSPIRSESSDVRARAPTVNPLLQTTNDRGEHKVGRDDIESSDAEEQQQNGPALEETLDDEKHLISSVLLFSGVAPPALSRVSAFLRNCLASVSWATGPLPFKEDVGPP